MPITLDTFRILVIVAGMAFLAACDTSENPDLLNPPGSDSTRARAINLASNDDLNVTIGAQSIATGLSAATTGPDALLFFNDAVAVAFRFGQRSDTLASSPIPRTVDDEILLSWIGMATPSKTTLATVLTSRIESGTLSSGDQARIYFFNGTDSAGLSLHQDCPNGPAIFAGVPDVALGGSSDLGVGSYSLYIGGFSGAPSARLELQPGAIVGLALRLKADGTPELVSFDLSPDAPERAPIETTMAETITTGQIRLVNGLGDSPIDATMLETSEPVAVGLPTGGISDVAEITPCSGSAGDSLAVVVAGNTTHLAVSPSIGAARTVLVFREDGTLRAQTLAPPTEAESGMVRFRAINIATSDSILAVQAGAGAPGDASAGAIFFPALSNGSLNSSRSYPAGLYPLSLEIATSGRFLGGALERFSEGSWLLLALPGAEGPELRFMRDDDPNAPLTRAATPAVRSLLYSTATGPAVTLRIGTSVGELEIPELPYSFVYPTLLPIEQITIDAGGGVQQSADVPSAGLLVGITGLDPDRRLLTHPRSDAPVPSDVAAIRFLSTRPDAPSIAVRDGGTEGEVLATIDFNEPSILLEREGQQSTFAFTPSGTNDELARIQGLQLSRGRSYLLLLGPAGVTDLSGKEYSTVLVQE